MKKYFFLFVLVGGLAIVLLSCGRDNSFYGRLGIQPDEIQMIEMNFTWNDTTRGVILQEKDEKLKLLLRYLDCEVEKVEIPTGAYEEDPLSLTIWEGDEATKISLLTTEGDAWTDSELHWITEDGVFKLGSAEQQKYLSLKGDLEYWCGDPLYEFFIMCVVRDDLEHQGDWQSRFPRYIDSEHVTVYDEPLRTYEEIAADSCYIVLGTVNTIVRHQSVESRAEIRIDEVWKGEPEGEVIDIRRVDGLRQNQFFHIGISERPLQEGKQYVFFIKKGEHGEWAPADERFGILEVTEDGMVRPIFNVDLARIEEYYIPLEALRP